MNDRLNAFTAKIDALKFNERVLILAAVLLVLAGAWDTFLMAPVERDKSQFAESNWAKRSDDNKTRSRGDTDRRNR